MTDTLEVVYRLAEISVVVAGGISILLKMGKLMGAFEAHSADLTDMKKTTKQLTEVIIELAVQKNELVNVQKQTNMLFDWYDELRRGKGYIKAPDR